MSNESDLVLSLAEEAIRDLARPDVFVSGQAAAYALLAKLSKYRQKQTAGKSAPPLNAHLLPCRRALEAMLGIRGKYPMRADKLGFADGVKWGLDRSRSETQVEVLRQSTAQVREIADHMPTRNDRPGPRRGGTSQAPQDQPPTIINQIYVSQESNQASSSSYSAANTAATSALAAVGAGGKPMCPNGSGCRAPYCFRDNNHPQAPACANGRNCFDSACRSYHDKVAYCGNGGGCAGRDTTCKKAHPWPRPAVPPGNVNARGTSPFLGWDLESDKRMQGPF
ncbi:hypothetical protein OQA88_9457 [Cercophora sp. LCS_1]